MEQQQRPFWWPDTQGFLAIAIVCLIAVIILILLTSPPQMNERVAGVLMTLVGVLIACMKDVYAFFFGSSKGSAAKDDVIIARALPPQPPGAPPPDPLPTNEGARNVA